MPTPAAHRKKSSPGTVSIRTLRAPERHSSAAAGAPRATHLGKPTYPPPPPPPLLLHTAPSPEARPAALPAAGRLVSVATPARVKAHAAAGGQGNKTDPADARAVAQFARDRQPPAWQPPTPEVRELQGLVRRVDDLVEMAAREKGRLASPAPTPAPRRSVGGTIRLLGGGADRVRAEPDAPAGATAALL